MADSFRVGIGNVPAVPGLGPDQGWVGMTRPVPGRRGRGRAPSTWCSGAPCSPRGRPSTSGTVTPGAEEFALIVRGQGIVLDGDNEIPVSAGDVVFHRKGAWHGFRNTSADEEAEMIWGWAGAASRAEAPAVTSCATRRSRSARR